MLPGQRNHKHSATARIALGWVLAGVIGNLAGNPRARAHSATAPNCARRQGHGRPGREFRPGGPASGRAPSTRRPHAAPTRPVPATIPRPTTRTDGRRVATPGGTPGPGPPVCLRRTHPTPHSAASSGTYRSWPSTTGAAPPGGAPLPATATMAAAAAPAGTRNRTHTVSGDPPGGGAAASSRRNPRSSAGASASAPSAPPIPGPKDITVAGSCHCHEGTGTARPAVPIPARPAVPIPSRTAATAAARCRNPAAAVRPAPFLETPLFRRTADLRSAMRDGRDTADFGGGPSD